MRVPTLKIQNIATIFAFFQFIIYLLRLVNGANPLQLLLILCIPINVLLVTLLHMRRINISTLIVFGAFAFFFILTTYFSSDYDYKFEGLMLGFSSFLIALMFQGQLAYKLIFFLNIIINFIVLIIGFNHSFYPNFGNEVLNNVSRNIVSGYMIFGMVYYLFFTNKLDFKINLPLMLLLVFNCIVLYGRTGIILAFTLLIYTLYKRLSKTLLVLFSTVSSLFLGIFLNYISSETNFSSGLDTPRIALYKEYFSQLTYQEFFFGRSVNNCCSLITSFDNNPHNSFIVGHMFYGITHTVLFLVIAIFIIFSRKWDLIFFMLLLYLRYSLDWLGTFHLIDVVIFSIFIYAYKISKRKNYKFEHKNSLI